jgi:hypothetical protein
VVTQLTETLAPNNWYHIAVVRDGNNFTLYVNGNPQDHRGGEDYWTHNLNEALMLGGRSRDGIVEH